MIGVRLFFVALALLLVGVQAFQQWVASPRDPFAPGQEQRLGRLVMQFNPILITEKVRHVVETGPYDLLLFGNSSILALGQTQLGGHGRVFSMAIPGSSLGSSASLARILGEQGALAPTLIVMVEHFDHFTQQVQMLPLRYRWTDTARILWESLRDPAIPRREWLRMAARLGKEEAVLFGSFFNAAILMEHVKLVFSDLFPPYQPAADGPVWATFAADGAAGSMTAAQPGLVPVPAMMDQPQILPAYIAYDLHRLASLPGKPRVIVYESPFEPATAAHYAAQNRPGPRHLRQVFLEACAREGLECHLAPLLGPPGEPNLWTDHYHPPAAVITPFAERLLSRAKPVDHAVQ